MPGWGAAGAVHPGRVLSVTGLRFQSSPKRSPGCDPWGWGSPPPHVLSAEGVRDRLTRHLI